MGIFLSGHRVSFSGVRFMIKSNDVVVTGINQVVLANSAGYNLVDMKIHGNSVQDGTPTLEAPIEIQSVGEKTKNLVNIPIIDSSTGTKTISCYIDQTISFSCQEYPTLIARDDGTEISIWRIAFKRLDGSITYAVDSALQGEGITLTTVTADNPIISIEYRSTYIREGAYKGIQIEYGREITEFEPYGYKIPISIGGKNLVNVSSDKNTYGYLDSNGNVVSHSAIKYTDFIGVGNATQITFSGMASNGMSAPSTCFYDKNKTFISGVAFAGSGEKTIDIPANARYFRTCFRTSYTQFMAEFGSVATSYVDYLEPTTTNIYLKEPLRKVNDVADILDYKNKKVIRNVASVIYNGTEKWAAFASAYNGYSVGEFLLKDGTNVLCNLAPSSLSNQTTLISIRKNYRVVRFQAIATIYSTLESFKEFLSTNNMEVIGQLATPTEETIDVPTLPTTEGNCVYEILTKVEPTYLEVTYKEKT